MNQVAELLHLAKSGAIHNSLKSNIEKLNLSIEHFQNRINKDYVTNPISYYLKLNGPVISSRDLKNKLISEGILQYECSICHISDWLNKPITLQLDHIDGNRKNNTIENLRILCPNCHTQTETWGGKNVKVHEITKCGICLTRISKSSKFCKTCLGKSRLNQNTKIEWPNLEDLLTLVNNTSFLEASRQLGVSDNTIRKKLKKNGLL